MDALKTKRPTTPLEHLTVEQSPDATRRKYKAVSERFELSRGNAIASQTAIETKRLGKVFQFEGQDTITALENVCISIRENEFFTLLGPSGCGKTTLLRLIAGFDFPTEGEILLFGQAISRLPPFKRPVNTVFQNYALFPHMTVAQNIGFGLQMLGKSQTEIALRTDQMLRLVRMEDVRDRKTSQISGGQQQRVALARALAPQPKVLLLDEPLSALDFKLRKDMQMELKRLQLETEITFIFVTHDQQEALTMSDRIAVMSKGRVLQVGSAKEIYNRPAERFVANFIGDANVLDGEIVFLQHGQAKIKLTSGTVLSTRLPDYFRRLGRVTLVVRPEHASLVKATAKTEFTGVLENVVYFGADTHCHLRLRDGSPFIVRRQNNSNGIDQFETGDTVGIVLADEAAQILKD